jgi:hypothetical protein
MLHIGGASVGMLSGAAALATRKGGHRHRLAGHVFFAAMLTMSAVAAVTAPLLPTPQWSSTVAGLLTFYLTATAWATVRRPPGATGVFEVGAMFFALGVAGLAQLLVWRASAGSGLIDGQPAQVMYLFIALMGLAAGLDLKVIVHGGAEGAPRIARHLWRMCAALFMATGSFFIGQQRVMPAAWHGSPLLLIPAFAPLAAMVFWLVRVRFAGRRIALSPKVSPSLPAAI